MGEYLIPTFNKNILTKNYTKCKFCQILIQHRTYWRTYYNMENKNFSNFVKAIHLSTCYYYRKPSGFIMHMFLEVDDLMIDHSFGDVKILLTKVKRKQFNEFVDSWEQFSKEKKIIKNKFLEKEKAHLKEEFKYFIRWLELLVSHKAGFRVSD